MLYPPHCLYNDVLKEELFLRLAPLQDDFWFFAMALLNGVKINVVEDNYTEFESYVDTSVTGALWLQNAKSANDEVLSLLLAHYPQLRERIKA